MKKKLTFNVAIAAPSPVDWTLIEDETYFVIETVERAQKAMVGCVGCDGNA